MFAWLFTTGLSEQELREQYPGNKACPFSNHEPRAYLSFWGWCVGCEFCGIRTPAFPTLRKALAQWNNRHKPAA